MTRLVATDFPVRPARPSPKPIMFHALVRNYRASLEGLPREVWIVSIVQLINRSGTMVLPFFSIYLKSSRGYAAEQVGWMLGIYGVGSLLGSYLGGELTNRWGGLRVQIVSLLLAGIGLVVLLWARTFGEIAACIFFVSLTAEALRPAAVTSITYFVPNELHARAFVLIRLAVNIGWSIGPVLGGFLATIGYEYLFIIDGLTCMLAGLYLLREFGWSYEIPQDDSQSEASASGAVSQCSPWRDTEFLLTLVLQFFIALVFFQMLGTLTLYFKNTLALNELQIGLLFGVNTITIIFLEMPLIRALDGIRPLKLLAWGCLLTGLGYGLLPFGKSIPFVSLSILVWTFGEMLSSSPAMTYTSSRANRQSRGAFVGLHTMCLAAATIVAPILGTRLYVQDPNLLWHLGSVIGIVTFLGLLLIDRRGGQTVPHIPAR